MTLTIAIARFIEHYGAEMSEWQKRMLDAFMTAPEGSHMILLNGRKGSYWVWVKDNARLVDSDSS